MSTRRRTTSDSRSPSPAADSVSPSPPRRQSREVRISTGTSSGGKSNGGSSLRLSASRTRKPTPVVRRSRTSSGGRLSEVMPHDHQHHHDESASDEEADEHDDQDQGRRSSGRRQVSINAETSSGTGRNGGRRSGGGRNFTLSANTSGGSSRTALDGSRLSWYERMMPECVLNMTAPITGYECELERHGELDDYTYEILERERVRRNRAIRKRLSLVMLAAGLASAYFIYRGRMPMRRPPGIRGAVTAMTTRLEDGLSKTLQDTMGK